MRKYLLTVLAFLLPLGILAQSKGETSLYQKTLKKPSVKAAQKFLKKYPESVYAPKVVRLRDSLLYFALDPEDAEGVKEFALTYPDSPFAGLASERILRHNTSLISREEALSKAGDAWDAIGWRKDNVEHILALDKDLTVRVLTPEGVLVGSTQIPVYSLHQEVSAPTELLKPLSWESPIGRRQYLSFAYLNRLATEAEYVDILYLPEEDILNQAMFYGKVLREDPLTIEGESPEGMEGLTLTPEVAYLLARQKENPALQQIWEADLLSDAAIRWWLQKNPKAETSATKLSFGMLDGESSLAAAYRKASKEKGKSYNVAQFNLRGYTVLCAQSKTSGEYLLVWCEPVCKNKKKDKYLSTTYFESNGTTLDLCYYKGNTTFKIKISMANQSVRR